MFCQGYEGKEAFLEKKASAQKTTKICIFLKGVSPWFLSKNGDFLIFSFYAKWIKKRGFLKVARKKKLFGP